MEWRRIQMNKNSYREEKIYLQKDNMLGQGALATIKNTIANNNAVGTLVGYYDEALSILSVSDYLIINLGYSCEEFEQVTQGSLRNLICGENITWADPEVFPYIHGSGEGQMLACDGTPIDVRMYKEDSRDAEGNPIWVLSVRVDWEHENLSLVNESIGSGPWYMDYDRQGNIEKISWSHAFRRLLGFHDTRDFPNVLESWSDLLHPEDKEKTLASLRAAISDVTNMTKYDVEYRMRMQDGSYQWFRAIAEVKRRGDGSPKRIAGIFININADRQMQEENSAMEHLIHSMTRVVDHFATCDLKKNHYSYHNIKIDSRYPKEGAYTDLIRLVTEKMKVLNPLESFAELISAENLRAQLKNPDDVYKLEYCDYKEDIFRIGSFVPLQWDGGTLEQVLWISIDVTEQKKLEIESRKALNEAFNAAERANMAKTEFLTNMSHDIRTPMNAIVGLTALAGANIDNTDRVIEYLGKITKSSRHLLGLINEVLDMARIESGRISLSDEEFYISDLVDNLITMVKPEMEAHHHNFEVNIDHIEHEAVCGDSLRVQQVFTNFMSNAIKYTPDGGNITFTIREKPNGFSELGYFEFSIEDDGIGMTKEFQEIMFQPFSRADDRRTTKIQGTGLGMAIARNIIQMMNGEIAIESEPNHGTKVTVTIYLRLQDKKMEKLSELMDLPVLVVDDDISSCESTVESLKEIGIAGEWVSSGEEAVERTISQHEKHEDYFAILMDWQMPGMDGIETTRQIRRYVGNDMTIIVLTAYDYSEIEDEARAAGVDAFITKPLFRSRLAATFSRIVSDKPEKSARSYLNNMRQVDYSGKRILLVEDNDLNREIASEIIGMTKVQVDTASNGKEAVEKIADAPEDWYDLIFMDIQMPIMNGYEATAVVRTMPGRRREVPIIAVTANAFAEDVQLAKNTGMNGHIAKPLEMDKLYDVMKKWLG